jgi:GGDEF domain-containing protein
VSSPTRPYSADIHVGVVCGLGAAAAAWTIAGSPNLVETECLAFVILASWTAAVLPTGARVPRLARSAAVGSALLLFGLGAALVVAELVTVGAWLTRRVARGPLFLLGLLHALAVAAIGALVPGLSYLGLGGGAPITLDAVSLGAVAGAVAASVATARTLAVLSRPGILEDGAPREGLRSWWRSAASEIGAAGLAILVATIYATDARAWLLVVPAMAMLSRTGVRPERRAVRAGGVASEPAQRAIAEALAHASAARGRTDLEHLDRVEALALDLAIEAGLAEADLDALAVAALLHDIDALALPDDRVVVEGRLEPHPALGAEILGALPFPESARAIVRHRFERWDGTGRPAGLVGEAIPLGARILAAVDAFDEWTWTPGLRRGAEGALDRLRAGAGTRFDPRLVEILERRARTEGFVSRAPTRLSAVGSGASTRLRDAARELHALYEIERSIGYRLDLHENLLLVLGKLSALVPHEMAVVYELQETSLRARFALGSSAAAIDGLELPLDRLSARAATQRRTLTGGMRDGFDLADLSRDPRVLGLASELAAPLVLGDRVLGSLTLYAGPERRFDAEDRRIVASVAGHVAAALLRSDPCDASYLASLTDPDTGLPNARYLEICAADAVVGPVDRCFGLVAFRWLDFDTTCERGGIDDATRAMGVLGRRIAAACGPREVAARFGTDVFVVLAAETEPSVLIERWGALLHAAEAEPIAPRPGAAQRVRCASAQVSAPADGRTLDALLGALGARLGPTTHDGARVVPFRTARSTG